MGSIRLPGPSTLVVHGQEFHTSYWGHLGILGPRGGILLPGYAGLPEHRGGEPLSDERRRR